MDILSTPLARPSPLAEDGLDPELSDAEIRLIERMLQGRPPMMISPETEQRLVTGGYLAWEDGRLMATDRALALRHLFSGRRAPPRRAGRSVQRAMRTA